MVCRTLALTTLTVLSVAAAPTETGLQRQLAFYQAELAKLKEQNDELSAKWHTEKIKFETLHQLRQKVDNLKQEVLTAERDGNLERVAEITYGALPKAEKDFQIFEKKNFGSGVKVKRGKAAQRGAKYPPRLTPRTPMRSLSTSSLVSR